MIRTVTIAPVRTSLRVEAPQAVAFRVFTAGIDGWWPRQAHLGKSPMAAAISASTSSCASSSISPRASPMRRRSPR
jgi:hypothetical protein